MEGEIGSINLGRVEKTKECLSSYKEILSVSWEVLTWKQEWFSVILVALVTFLYTIVWWNDITVLTAASLLGIVFVCVDLASLHGKGFLGSMIAWNSEREREFTDLCVWLSQAQERLTGFMSRSTRYRETSPLIYYVSVSVSLLFLAWIGSSVPNMLLCYWATVLLVLAPGISRSGLVAKYAAQVYSEIQKLLRRYLPVRKTAAPAKED